MKQAILILLVLVFSFSSVYAADFSPSPLRFSIASSIQYEFDGSELEIPVTISGANAVGVFLVHTKDKGSAIGEVVNGFLGWHHVNSIDTCLYISDTFEFGIGQNTITWDGKDDDGAIVPAGEYTYYVWGMNSTNQKVLVNNYILNSGGSGGAQALIQEYDETGNPLANPVFYNRASGIFQKFAIGGDPNDESLIETTSVTLGQGWGVDEVLTLYPTDHEKFFISGMNSDSILKGCWKFDWVPNGESIIDTEWGEDGFAGVSRPTDAYSGPVADNNYLYYINNQYHGYNDNQAEAELLYIDLEDGSIINTVDLSDWWSDPDDYDGGGQMNGGPNGMMQRNGYLFLNCHCSCTKQMVDPLAEDEEDFYLWTNRNGDYILDHNFSEDSARPWVCNDYKVGPYTYSLHADANLFSCSPTYDMGAVSFGLLGPDGSGIGHFAYAGETAAWKWWTMHVDNGSSYDGQYCDNNSQNVEDPFNADKYVAGVYYVAHDSVTGTITNKVVAVEENTPGAFTVAQNSPNPFNPTTTINFSIAEAGNVSVDVYNVSGQKVDTITSEFMNAGSHTLTWDASNFSAGVYFYTVKTGNFSKTMKMTLLK